MDVSDGGGALLELGFGIFPFHGVVHEERREHEVGSQAEGFGEIPVFLGIVSAVGEDDVDRDGLGVRGRHQEQSVGQRTADAAHAADGGERGLIDGEDGGLRLPGLGLVEAEHVIVGGIIHLPAELPTAQYGYKESRRQEAGIRCEFKIFSRSPCIAYAVTATTGSGARRGFWRILRTTANPSSTGMPMSSSRRSA